MRGDITKSDVITTKSEVIPNPLTLRRPSQVVLHSSLLATNLGFRLSVYQSIHTLAASLLLSLIGPLNEQATLPAPSAHLQPVASSLLACLTDFASMSTIVIRLILVYD